MRLTFKTMLVSVMAILTVAFASCCKEENDNGGGSADAGGSGTNRYTLTVKPNNPAWGTVTGGGTYNSGDRVDLYAEAASGYYFIRWSDGISLNPRTITVNRSMTWYALFSDRADDPTPFIPADTMSPGPEPQCGWVDLGLPSGLLWAECNVGAMVPEEYGDYFAWGETQPKSDYSWNTYRYCTVDGEGNLSTLTKYNTLTDYGSVDNLTILNPSDDAATVCLGGGARTPTKEEWEELMNNTTVKWTTKNGVHGRKLTAANGNTIFLPATGRCKGSEIVNAGDYGFYWSALLNTDHPHDARDFRFSSGFQAMRSHNRHYGLSVRAVRAGQN